MQVDLTSAKWRKSTHSNGQGGCIEVADGFPGTMPVRDSKDPHGPSLFFTAAGFSAFVQNVKNGSFGAI
ncbi:DUF397 domain-containing protein [Kitasatospora viridis]|uniref:Uncharacterized protein DUF397 n=1 Tax=Kitasatospora viridis TaxID=281105 RepID=A0A561ULM1_9ACTN|nr:DUF397 domain-containing protein [Kitasatospora viridis]TWG00288.1 uncharacterized protein DUF397 [Kitasatospora viridis]